MNLKNNRKEVKGAKNKEQILKSKEKITKAKKNNRKDAKGVKETANNKNQTGCSFNIKRLRTLSNFEFKKYAKEITIFEAGGK
ncbi:MAG: hypothetical protein JW917_10340 [Ignavibacteria bacterium]|nr:hypothetical protein [Ignavibacteria bacterium]